MDSLKKVISSIIVLIIVSFIAIKINNYIEIFIIPEFEDINGYLEQLLTISTILMGFAFTVMGLLYTFDASDFVKKLESTDYVIKRANIILFCLWILGVSSISSLCLMIFNINKIYMYMYVFSVLSLLMGVILFIMSTDSVYKLIRSVHEYDKKKVQKKYKNYTKEKRKSEEEDEVDGTW